MSPAPPDDPATGAGGRRAADPPARDRPLLDRLEGARVQRVDAPEPHRVFAITLQGGPSREVMILRRGGGAPSVGLVSQRPRGAPADGFAQRLRRDLVGGRLAAVQGDPRGASVVTRWATREGIRQVAIVPGLAGGPAGLVLLDGDRRLLAGIPAAWMRARRLRPGATLPDDLGGELQPLAVDALRRDGARMRAGDAEDATRGRWNELRRRLTRTRARLRRKARAIAGDAARGERAGELRRQATLLLASPDAQVGADGEVQVTDWEREPPAPIRVLLEAGRTPQQQADLWFHRARRLERGTAIAEERLAETTAALARVEALLAEVDELRLAGEARLGDAAVGQLEARWRALGLDRGAPAPTVPRPSAQGAGRRLPYRSLRGAGGREIRVGRSAADNDELTLRHARPGDLWLHARSVRGAHVVVPLGKKENVPAPLLVDAAMLAAHFSELSGEAVVEVQYTERRHVRKPRGAAAGAVTVEREKTIAVRLEGERLRGLLDSEKPPGP